MKKFNVVICFLMLIMVGFCFAGCMEDGTNGKSAYEIAVDNGFEGTEAEWLESLKGENGKDADAPTVEIDDGGYWVINGKPTNVKAQGVDGKDGVDGVDGKDGTNGETPTISISNDGYWVINNVKTSIKAKGENGKDGVNGADGKDGTNGVNGENGLNGTNGKSAYEIAVDNGFEGSEAEWLESLKGADGQNGEDGNSGTNGKSAYQVALDNGFEGTEAEWLESLKGDSSSSVVSTEVSYSKAVNTGLLSVVAIKSTFSTVGTMAGSGVIIQDDKATGTAYILTNYHVLYDKTDKNATEIVCFLYGQYNISNYRMVATLVGGSMKYDIAVIKIVSDVYKESVAKPVSVRNSDEVNMGDNVILIGNAMGYGFSTTAGIVSVPSETATVTQPNNLEYVNRLIRVDAPVNGGNSGGGLFDLNGNLLGIVKAKISKEEIEGIGFVIPSNVAYSLAQNIIQNCNETNKQAKLVDLGVNVGISSSTMKKDADGNVRIYEKVYISSVSTSSIFYNQLHSSDQVKSITVNGVTHEITRSYQVEELLFNLNVGTSITFKVARGNNELTYSATFTSSTAIV